MMQGEPRQVLPWLAALMAAPLAAGDERPSAEPPSSPTATLPEALSRELAGFLAASQISTDVRVRVSHAHGRAHAELWALQHGELPRVPDVVVFPAEHEHVERLARAAEKHGACLLPFGAGTNASGALGLPPGERRPILSVDMRGMNRIRWVDRVNRLACVEAGATGHDIATELGKYGLVVGHEPEGFEASTVGGWIARGESGRKESRYGSIEDVVLDMSVVRPGGASVRSSVDPRKRNGSDPQSSMFGSEGRRGIVTSAVVTLRAAPEVQRRAGVVFATLGDGLDFSYQLERTAEPPASLRLLDNPEHRLIQLLDANASAVAPAARLKQRLDELVASRLKGLDPRLSTLAVACFEGSAEEVARQESAFQRIAKLHGGVRAGQRGDGALDLGFETSWVRELMFRHWVLVGSVQAGVLWSHAESVHERVRARVRQEHEMRRLPGHPLVSGSVARVHSSGVSMHFHIGFYSKGVADAGRHIAELERAVREEISAAGGCASLPVSEQQPAWGLPRQPLAASGSPPPASAEGRREPASTLAGSTPQAIHHGA